MEKSRRNFLKKMLVGGAALTASSLGFGSNVFSKDLDYGSSSNKDFEYIFELINSGKELNELQRKILFSYYVGVWDKYYSFEGFSYNGKLRTLKSYLNGDGFNFIAGLLYMCGDKCEWLEKGGFVLNIKFKNIFNDFVPTRGYGVKKNFLEDFRVFFRLMRHNYYVVMVRMHLANNMGRLLGDLDGVLKEFNYLITKVRVDKYNELLLKNKFSVKLFETEINKSVLDYVYFNGGSPLDSRNIIIKLLNRVKRKDIGVFNDDLWNFKKPIVFGIVSSNVDLELRNLIFKFSLRHKIDPILPNLLCLLETSYGVGKNVSKKGAKGPLQVMPDAYFDVTGKDNFDSANRSELVEAGILNLIYLMDLFKISKTKNHYTFVDVFMVGVAYNAGLERLYDLVRVKDYKLRLEPTNYHQFLYFLFSHIIDFE